jgi:hypothetical protein
MRNTFTCMLCENITLTSLEVFLCAQCSQDVDNERGLYDLQDREQKAHLIKTERIAIEVGNKNQYEEIKYQLFTPNELIKRVWFKLTPKTMEAFHRLSKEDQIKTNQLVRERYKLCNSNKCVDFCLDSLLSEYSQYNFNEKEEMPIDQDIKCDYTHIYGRPTDLTLNK